MLQFLIILLFISFFFSVFQIFQIGTYGVTPTDLILLLFFLYILKKVIWDGVEVKIVKEVTFLFVFLLIVSMLFSGIVPLINGEPEQIIQYIKSSIHFLYLVSFAFVCILYPISAKIWKNAIRTWLILGLIVNIFGIYQIFARAYDLPLAWLKFTNVSLTLRGSYDIEDYTQLSLSFGNFYRATSIFHEPSALAGFNIYIIIFLLIPYIQRTKQFFRSKVFNFLMFVVSIITLFLTFSLTGLLGLLVILGAIILIEKKKRIKRLAIIVFSGITFLIIADIIAEKYFEISVMELFQQRVSSIISHKAPDAVTIVGESFITRLESADKTIKIWRESPFLGVGLGLTAYQKKYEIHFSDYTFLSALAEMGILGGLAILGLFFSLLITTLKLYKRNNQEEKITGDQKLLLGIILYLAIFQIILNFVTSNLLINFVLWLTLGMIFSIISDIKLKTEGEAYIISLFQNPLKIQLKTALAYIKANSKLIRTRKSKIL